MSGSAGYVRGVMKVSILTLIGYVQVDEMISNCCLTTKVLAQSRILLLETLTHTLAVL